MDPGMHNTTKNDNNDITLGKDAVISSDFLTIISSVIDLWLCLFVALVGVCANVVTAIVFVRMGFKDTVNITMTFVTFWDLIRTLCGVLHRCYGPVSLISPLDGVSWQNITLTNIVYLQLIASNIAYVVSAYASLERGVCVSAPFAVKGVFTPRLTIAVCSCLSCAVFATQFPIMLVSEHTWVTSPQPGKLVAIYQFTSFYKSYGQSFIIFFRYVNMAYSVVSLAIMMVSTMVISHQLKKSSIFRSSACAGKQSNSTPVMSTKEGQVVKMLILVIATYMLVLVPRVAHYAAQVWEPGYYSMKQYDNIFWTVVYIISLLDFINSSVSLFIFYSMSTNFRKTCQKMFPLCNSVPPGDQTSQAKYQYETALSKKTKSLNTISN